MKTFDDWSRSEPAKRLAHRWGLPMAIGIVLIVAGGFALYTAALTSLISTFFLGSLLLGVGVLDIVSAFRLRHDGPFLVYFLAGILSLVVGGLFLYRPLASLASLTLLIAGFMFASGLFRGLTAVVDRYPHWGADLAYSMVTLMLGVLVIAEWPASSLWLLGTVVAVEILVRGVALVSASWVLREIDHGGFPRGAEPA